MDLNLPDISGLDVTKEIMYLNKNNMKEKIDTIIIGLTGYLTNEIIEKCTSAGMSDVIAKPCTKLKILESLKRYNLVFTNDC